MKILFVSPAYEPAWPFGGVVRCISNLCRGLAAQDHTVTVYTTNANGMGQALQVPIGVPVERGNVAVSYFPSTFGSKSIWDSRALVRKLKRTVEQYDIVYVSAVWQWLGYATSKICHKHGVPLVFGIHGSLNSRLLKQRRFKKALYWNFFLQKALRMASAIHFTTGYERAESREPKQASFIVPNGLETNEFRPSNSAGIIRRRYSIPANAHLVLTVGRIHPIKRMDILIKALLHADNIYLAIVGPDEGSLASEYQEMSRHLGVEDKIIWMGYQTGKDLVDIYSAADIYASLSEHENFGMTVIEAMACGLPILVSQHIGVWHELQDAQVGLAIESKPQVVAKSWMSLAENPDMWTGWGENAKRIIEERFSIDKVAELMGQAFNDVLTGQRSPQCKWKIPPKI